VVAISRCTQCTTWVEDQTVYFCVRASYAAATPRHSIGMAA
jgi:hypothetical protein